MNNIFYTIANEWGQNAENRHKELLSGSDQSYYSQIIPHTFQYLNSVSSFGMEILDVGCGLGYITGSAHQAGYRITGLDMSSDCLYYARKQFSEINFIEANLLSYQNATSKQYDICLAIMMFHNSPDLSANLSALFQLLKPGGFAFIGIPHPRNWIKKFDYIDYYTPSDRPEHLYKVPFKIKNGIVHPAKISYFHRTIETYLQQINLSGLRIECIHEKGGSLTQNADLLFFHLKKADIL